ncbi:MAG: T9SS type A sorting domain-containing protein [bacterium]|nr:MAG: T9SS type A sorting domain-containing protein [bacterium]
MLLNKFYLVSVAIIVFAVMILLLPTYGSANQVVMSDCNGGFHDVIYYSNEQVCVTGDFDCLDDWPLPIPVARIYIVQDNGHTWSSGATLVDNMGAPNTIQGSGVGGAFYDEVIALPYLPLGRFDVVIDENENGMYDPCNEFMDYVLGQGSMYAFEVIDTDLECVVDTAAIKDDARDRLLKWRSYSQNLVYSLKTIEAAMFGLQFVTATASATLSGLCLGLAIRCGIAELVWLYGLKVNPKAYKLIGALCTTLAERYEGIANDPPDPSYMEIVELAPIYYQAPATADTLPVACVPVYDAISENAVLLTAVRSCLEKFFGAEEVSDNRYIRIQALALKRYTDLLIDVLNIENDALENLRAVVDTAGGGNITIYPDSFAAFQARVGIDGFYTEELDLMDEAGFDSIQISFLKEEIICFEVGLATEGTVLAHIDSTIQSNTDLLPVLEDLAIDAQAAIDTTSLVWIDHPRADAGGPYTGPEGSMITLDGSGSSDPNNSTLTYEWDLDADSLFGDEIGSVVQAVWSSEGHKLVGLKVTNASGYHDVDYARVDVASVNDGPVFTAVDPDSAFVPLTSCDSLVFTVSVSDPDGDPVAYEWVLDDSIVCTAGSWTFDPRDVDSGRYTVTVLINDGSPLSPDNQASWCVETPYCPPTAVPDDFLIESIQDLTIRHTWVSSGLVRISFSVPRAGNVTLAVYDVAGRRIRTLVSKRLSAGYHDIIWDGYNRLGYQVTSGVYFCRLTVGNASTTRKIVYVR